MSDKEKDKRPKIKKIVINNRSYVDLEQVKREIGMLGAYMILEGRVMSAVALADLLKVFSKDDIYDTFPKENTKDSDDNIVNLFGDNT